MFIGLYLAGPPWAPPFQFGIKSRMSLWRAGKECLSGWRTGMVGWHGVQLFGGDENCLSGCNSGCTSVVGDYCSDWIDLVGGVSGPVFFDGVDDLGCPFLVCFWGSVYSICKSIVVNSGILIGSGASDNVICSCLSHITLPGPVRAVPGLFTGCFEQKSYVHSRGPHGPRAAPYEFYLPVRGP